MPYPRNLGLARPSPRNLDVALPNPGARVWQGRQTQITWVWKGMSYPRNVSLIIIIILVVVVVILIISMIISIIHIIIIILNLKKNIITIEEKP